MRFADSPEEQTFREEVRTWLADHLVGAYRSLGATAAVQEGFTDRLAWERELGKSGWVGLSWPREHGGRAATLTEELIFAQEYARAKGPTRVGYFGESLVDRP